MLQSSALLLPIFKHRCCHFLGTLVAKNSAFLIAKSSALLLTDYNLSCRKESFVVISFHSWSDWTPSAPLCLRFNEPDILLSLLLFATVESAVPLLFCASHLSSHSACSRAPFLCHPEWYPDFFFISSVPVPELLQQALTGSEISLPVIF